MVHSLGVDLLMTSSDQQKYNGTLKGFHSYSQLKRLKHGEFLLGGTVSIARVLKNFLVVRVGFVHWGRWNVEAAAPDLDLKNILPFLFVYASKFAKCPQHSTRMV